MLIIRLKYERLRRGLSQAALGIAARVDASAISQIEIGRYDAGPKVLRRLAAVLHVPADELLKPVAISRPELRAAATRQAEVRR